MPEKEENFLPGETTLTPSSDAYVASQVESIRNEIYGVGGQVVEAGEADILPPKPVTKVRAEAYQQAPIENAGKIITLTYKDSRLGSRIRLEREAKRKRAA